MVISNVTTDFYNKLMEASDNGTRFGAIGITSLDAVEYGNIGVAVNPLARLNKEGVCIDVTYNRYYKNHLPDDKLLMTYKGAQMLKGIPMGSFVSEDFDPDEHMPFLKPTMSITLAYETFADAERSREWVESECGKITTDLDVYIKALVLITDECKKEYLLKHIQTLDEIDRQYL